MPTKEELKDHARKLYNALDSRIKTGIGPNKQWEVAQALAVVDLGPADPEPVNKEPKAEEVLAQPEAKKDEGGSEPAKVEPKETRWDKIKEWAEEWLAPRLWVAFLSFIIGLVALAYYLRPGPEPVPARYKVATARYQQDVDKAKARFVAAKACQDLRALSGSGACEIR